MTVARRALTQIVLGVGWCPAALSWALAGDLGPTLAIWPYMLTAGRQRS